MEQKEQQMQLLNTFFFFTRGAKTVISNIKLPFTVVDFCTPAKTSVMMGKCPRQIVSK